ncbi:MAG TPA: hypothetical protein VM050_06690 [Patescibacteria group bacterium]|nr:hypothetical protein [Patescibacteria group bacterium]
MASNPRAMYMEGRARHVPRWVVEVEEGGGDPGDASPVAYPVHLA